MKKIFNLISLIRYIQKTIIISFLVIVTISIIILILTKIEFENNQNSLEKSELHDTIHIFQSSLSEKLNLIASSDVFIDYINSGETTRKEMSIPFIKQMIRLKSSAITGMKIINSNGDYLFNYGQKSEHFSTLKVCYLNRELNNKYGNCNIYWTLYFDKEKLINELKKLNHNIYLCKNCISTEILSPVEFGSFIVFKTSGLTERIALLNTTNYFNYFFVFFLLIITLLIGWIFIKINNVFNLIIINPLNEITKSLKNGHIPKNKQYIEEIDYLISQLVSFYATKDKIELIDLSVRVAHDIRSPLAVMEMSLHSLQDSLNSDEVSMIKTSIQSVRDIANNLLNQYRTFSSNPNDNDPVMDDGNIERYILLASIIESVVSQKNKEWELNPCDLLVEIKEESKDKWILSSPNALKRMLSNLLNNSYESISDNKKIKISLYFFKNYLVLIIKDNGHGIPKEKLPEVLQGLSLKHAGLGVGLSSANDFMASISGKLSLRSEENLFTEVSLTFPIPSGPNWYPDSICVRKNSCVLILDDDTSIHTLWKHRFNLLGINTIHFRLGQDLINWCNDHLLESKNAIYIIDYELRNDSFNGIDIFKLMDIQRNGYLITSHAEELWIQAHCKQINAWLIPKYLTGSITIIALE